MRCKAFYFLGFLSFFLWGCGSLDNFKCPYVLTNPQVKLEDRRNVCNFAYVDFDLFNQSDRTITGFTISFNVYDSQGENPFFGSNTVTQSFETCIPAGEMENFCLNLDPYISVVPSEPYKLDFIYIQEIKYSDGTKWSDLFGMYAFKDS